MENLLKWHSKKGMFDFQGIDVLIWDSLWNKWVPRCWSRYTWAHFVRKDNNFWILEKFFSTIQVHKVQFIIFVIFNKNGEFQIYQIFLVYVMIPHCDMKSFTERCLKIVRPQTQHHTLPLLKFPRTLYLIIDKQSMKENVDFIF